MKATTFEGNLKQLDNCYIDIPGYGTIVMNVLPDISDSKQASYSDVNAIGRSSPMKSYSHSDNRTISWTAHFIVCKEEDIEEIKNNIKTLKAAVYPERGEDGIAPYFPPPICHIKCGHLLSAGQDLCAVLKSYSIKFPTDTVWHEIDNDEYFPYKIDIDLQFDIVYNSTELPYANDIITL